MKRFSILFIIIVALFAFAILQSCKHEPLYTVDKSSTSKPPAVIDTNKLSGLDGVQLYNGNCATCHGLLPTSGKLGATVDQINAGIVNNVGMHVFSVLTITQLQSISYALKITTPPVIIRDGVTLYTNNCSSCHGKLPESVKLGASVSRIVTAISTVNEMINATSLHSLSSVQIDSISGILLSTPMPTDGSSLYVINCARCHNGLSNSRVANATSSEIHQAINGKRDMKYLSTLTDTQIQAIASVLIGGQGGD